MAVIRKKGLGRGLSSLLGDDVKVLSPEGVREIALAKLVPGKYQPRTTWEDSKLKELADSIAQQGVISPIVVRATENDQYEIIAGERRFRASKLAGRKTIPAVVKTVNDKDALAMALIENMQREDLNAIEEAVGVQRLINEFDYSHEQAAQALGKSRSATTNLLRLLKLTEEVKRMLCDGRIEMGHARALIPLSAQQQIEIAKRIEKEGLNVRQVEDLINKSKTQQKKEKTESAGDKKTRDELNFEERLSDTLGAPLEIKYNAKKTAGKILISFSSVADLEAIAEKLGLKCSE